MNEVFSTPLDKSAVPAIRFGVRLQYLPNKEAILNVRGKLLNNNDKLLAFLEEDEYGRSEEPLTASTQPGFPRDANINLLAVLDQHSIESIEKNRKEDPKHDVYIKLVIYVEKIISNLVISNIHFVPIRNLSTIDIKNQVPSDQDVSLPLYWYTPNTPSNLGHDQNILAADSGEVFLRISRETVTIPHRIPSTDWVNDYLPKFTGSKYLTIEIPLDLEYDVYKRCYKYLEEAEKAFGNWNSKGVFANVRSLWKDLDEEIKAAVGVNSYIYEKWKRASYRFAKDEFNFASMDLHNEELEKKYHVFSVGRSDMEALLLSAKVLYKYAVELLEEAKNKTYP